MAAHPGWCAHCTQHTDGTNSHRGPGYPLVIDGRHGEVVPYIMADEPIVSVTVPTGDLTPGEARELGRALILIAAMTEDAAR